MKPVYIYSVIIIKDEKLREIEKQEQIPEKFQINNSFRNTKLRNILDLCYIVLF